MRAIHVISIFLLFAATAATGQTRITLDEIVEKARLASGSYRDALSDLIGEELKIFETRNGKGDLKKSRRIRSDILVYRSGKSEDSRGELRIVNSVNDRPVPDAAGRGERLIAELARSSTPIAELDRLQRESTRYDDTVLIYGVTLNQATVLHSRLRSAFRFEAVEGEAPNGRKVFVVKYVQTESTTAIAFNPWDDAGALITINARLPKATRASELRLRGTLWIDRESFRIWREERDVVIARDASVPLISSAHEYAVGDFGVLLPTRILFSINEVVRKEGVLKLAGRQTALFTYSNFRRTNVEIRISEDDPEPDQMISTLVSISDFGMSAGK